MESLPRSQEIAENVKRVQYEVQEAALRCGRSPADVRLMGVSKYMPPQDVNAAIAAGITLLGENKAQELAEKKDSLNLTGCEMHFIGALQKNKIKYLIGKVQAIQSVDSVSLAEEINRICQKHATKLDIFLEINIGAETTKAGFMPQAVTQNLCQIAALSNLQVRGLMAIPPICHKTLETERYFSCMQQIFVDIQGKKIDNVSMDYLSLGMSADYAAAIKHGSHIVRVGRAIFGARLYQ